MRLALGLEMVRYNTTMNSAQTRESTQWFQESGASARRMLPSDDTS